MLKIHTKTFAIAVLSGALVTVQTGCRQLPGSDEAQGATIGGLGGAAAGAVIAGEDNRLLGAILGGVIGAGGGYVIGANKDRIMGKDHDGARDAQQRAEAKPATAQEAINAQTADINADGFVTMDEVVAMEDAGLQDDQILEKLRSSGQVFDLTAEQKDYLRRKGVSDSVLSQINDVNRETKDRLMSDPSSSLPPDHEVIGNRIPTSSSKSRL